MSPVKKKYQASKRIFCLKEYHLTSSNQNQMPIIQQQFKAKRIQNTKKLKLGQLFLFKCRFSTLQREFRADVYQCYV